MDNGTQSALCSKQYLGCEGQMLHGSHLSGDEVPGKHDDIVLVQLVLTNSG